MTLHIIAFVLASAVAAVSAEVPQALHTRKAELLQELQAVDESLASRRWTNTCAKAGCHHRFQRGANCQCGPKCKQYGNCCSDYATKCEVSDDEPAGDDGPEETPEAFNETRPCMCAFDIDRTLTAGQKERCPSTTHRTDRNIFDDAYGGGRLKLGEVGALSISKTACANCYTAIVSRGTAAGRHSAMRKYVMNDVIQTDVVKKAVKSGKIKADWTDWYVKCHKGGVAKTPFIVRSPNECKKHGVEAIRQLYNTKLGINIAKRDVFFFDDHSSNLPVFKKFGMNAFEIGCASHSHGHTSRCGATKKEIRLMHLANGYKMCQKYGNER